jgi:hypothetical protein
MNNDIFVMQGTTLPPVDDVVEETGFGKWQGTRGEYGEPVATIVPTTIKTKTKGQNINIPNPDCLCKTVIFANNPDKVKYFILIDVYGNLVNPWETDPASRRGYRLSKISGKESFRMKEVSHTVFAKYLKFLVNKNETHYRAADREYRDA